MRRRGGRPAALFRWMRTAALTICATISVADAATAQAQGPGLVELDDLRTPASPAFVILGVSPTAVERPSTPRAFALGLVSAAEGQAGVIPENYAAEVAPYWLAPRRTLTFSQYFRPTLHQRLRQTFSVSLATAARAEGADSVTGVAVGFRIAPLVGEPSERLVRAVDTLRTVQDRMLTLDIQMDGAQSAADSARIRSQLSPLEAESVRLAGVIRQNGERVGLHLQIAGALAGYYPGGRFDSGTLGRSGLWGTLGMRLDDPGVDVIGLARVLWDDRASQTLWDLGGRAVLSYEDLSGSVEFIARSARDAVTLPGGSAMRSGNRVVGLLEYRVSPDLFVNFSFGQDYPRAGEDGQPLVAILGGQVNLGSKPLIAPTR